MKVDYSDISNTYDSCRSYRPALVKRMLEFGELQAGMRMLDVGCGTGNVSLALRELTDIDAIGIDRSIHMLELARAKGLQVLSADADHFNLPFRDSCFDRIVAAYVIQHINDVGRLFAECGRLLRDGLLLVLTSSHDQIERQHPVISSFFPSSISIEKARFPDLPQLRGMLKDAGFRGVEHMEVRVEGIPIDRRYLEQVKNKFVSTYHLLPKGEFEEGVKRLEAFIDERSETEYREWRGTLMQGRR